MGFDKLFAESLFFSITGHKMISSIQTRININRSNNYNLTIIQRWDIIQEGTYPFSYIYWITY